MKRPVQILLGIALILLGLGIPVTTTLVVFILPPQYLSTAKVIPARSAFTTVAREIEIIRSTRILYPVITNANLNQRFAARFHSMEPMPTEVTYALLRRELEAREQGDAHLIFIGVRNEDRMDASDIANEIARVYCAYTRSEVPGGADGASVLEPAQPSIRADRPNKPLAIGISLAMTLVLCTAGIWLLGKTSKPTSVPPKLPGT